MMEGGPPEQKRPRLVGPSPGPWQNSQETSRQLPPPSAPYPHSSFSRPEPLQHPTHPLDRRQSDHAQYDHQDSRRPGSGPSHGYHPPHSAPPPYEAYGGGRPPEPIIKRDPSAEPQQPHFRHPPGNGNGSGQDHNVNPQPPPPHHEAPPRPFLPPFEASNTRPPYPQSPYPPAQSPMSATEPYHYGPGPIPPPREQQYPSVSYPQNRNENNGPKKKATRAAQACDMCRTLKAKCDEGRPSCTSCREKQQDCRYRDPPPKQQDKASADILDCLVRIESAMNGMNGQIKGLTGKMEKVEIFLLANVPNAEAGLKEEPRDIIPQMPARASILSESHPSLENQTPTYPRLSISSESHPLQGNQTPIYPLPSISTELQNQAPFASSLAISRPDLLPPDNLDEEEEVVGGGDVGPPKDPAIPVNHTTGAARLLLVPAIARLCGPVLPKWKEKYPLVQESKRGLLRLYGRGEGNDRIPGYDFDGLVDNIDKDKDTPGDNDNSSPGASPAGAGEEWGQIGGLTPPGNPAPEITGGVIDKQGMPDVSREVVYELVNSYMRHMNSLHPILVPRRLDSLVEQFLRSIPDSQPKPKQVTSLVHHPSAGFVGNPGNPYRNPESPGNKRKRSPGGDYQDPPSMLDHKPGHPYRSIGTAIVLLVMALGKICQHKGKISDVYQAERESESSHASSPTMRNGHPPSPLQNSPLVHTPVMASPRDGDRTQPQPRSRRASIEGFYVNRGFSSLRPRNMDFIPGLCYFALATDIIGNQVGGNTLAHVHANILAGLYHAQLGRILESHSYINLAGRALQIMLRPKLDRFKKIKALQQGFIRPQDNPLVFAFWTCLQLESDIVAELPCPHSGILTLEEDMPLPNFQAASDHDGFDPVIIESYSAQLFLRKHLNQLHNMFYRPDNDSQFPSIFVGKSPQHFGTIQAAEDYIDIVDSAGPSFIWDKELGEPASDILGARLRAKYYGARVITYRHFILELLGQGTTTPSVQETQGFSEFQQGSSEFLRAIKDVPAINKKATSINDIDPKVLEYAKKGIKALVYSTKAFHGIGDPVRDRLIVTNIWGTAHAQWGNMLTLQAVYQSTLLKPLLMEEMKDVSKLSELLEQTIGFLDLVSTPTSALATDAKILRHAGIQSGLLRQPGASFSSN